MVSIDSDFQVISVQVTMFIGIACYSSSGRGGYRKFGRGGGGPT